MSILHFDSVGGASGDMILSALIDLGVKPADLNAALVTLGVGDIIIEALPFSDAGLRGTQATVHAYERIAHDHGHPHRTLQQVREAIEAARLSPQVKARSLAVFQRLAEAEAHVHGTSPEQVHFHEVGALDALADIVGACLGLEILGVTDVSVGPLPFGHGTIECAHGVLPNPAPGTLELLKGSPVSQTDEPFELVTPTGAALLTTWKNLDLLPDAVLARRVGHGFGHRRLQHRPNLLRAVLFERTESRAPNAEDCLVIETNLDDVNPEWVGALVQKLIAAGAYDAFTSAVQMKKQRPGILLTVLAPPANRSALLDLIFTESTTFGVREYAARRTVLPRESVEVATPFGAVRIKIGRWQNREVTHAPEYEDCARAAAAHGVPLRVVYEAAAAAYRVACPRSNV